ncbi:MAG: hypothetical protein DRP60_00910 [Spirochaetes bacterium]|nr:MAG: hypothetical protein DRP60_00910 [Spirochaetota bacterium]
MNRITSLIFLFFLSVTVLSAQETAGDIALNQGLDDMRNGRIDSAASIFRDIIGDSSLKSYFPEALYWLIKSDIALENYNEASRAVDGFLSNYQKHPYFEEITYHRGRLLFLEKNPDSAIAALGDFVELYPDSDFRSSAFYWIGESLMALGRLEEADAVFSELLSQYPSSIKREAARYRRSEISLLYRERELLDLLKWSHEEYLRDSEDFYRREAEYKGQIASFRSSQSDNNHSKRLLMEKAQLLDIKSFYINELMRLYNDQ